MGLRLLGISNVTGIEIDPMACLTAIAAGHKREQSDMASLYPTAFGPVRGLLGSPPCQGFSRAGKGVGRLDAVHLIDVAGRGSYEAVSAAAAELLPHLKDPRSILSLHPLRWVLELMPPWSAWEQVPAVLPLWEAAAATLREVGYLTWTGIVEAEQYGTPQTRRRAILMASRTYQPHRPTPTHSQFHLRSPARLDPGVLPWVTMAQALGWPEAEVVDIVTQRLNNQSGTVFDLSWPLHRPAPVIAGRALVTMPGANANRFNGATKSRNDGIRMTAPECGILQTFPGDYPWAGNVTEVHTQIGNACPPVLARAIADQLIQGEAA